jgi:hypothetical protein
LDDLDKRELGLAIAKSANLWAGHLGEGQKRVEYFRSIAAVWQVKI